MNHKYGIGDKVIVVGKSGKVWGVGVVTGIEYFEKGDKLRGLVAGYSGYYYYVDGVPCGYNHPWSELRLRPYPEKSGESWSSFMRDLTKPKTEKVG